MILFSGNTPGAGRQVYNRAPANIGMAPFSVQENQETNGTLSLKARVYFLLEGDPEKDGRAAWSIDFFLMLLIIANVVATVLESVRSIGQAHVAFFAGFEVFSVEYIIRLWVCTGNPAFAAPVTGRVRYAITLLTIVDLLAVLPFFVPFLIPVDLRFMRILRLMRIFRLLKLSRHSSALKFVRDAFVKEKEALAVTAFVLVILVVFSSCLMYFLEHEAQPQAFASIPHTMWWAVETLTTVGYGDIVPVTPARKHLGSFIATPWDRDVRSPDRGPCNRLSSRRSSQRRAPGRLARILARK